MDSIWLHIVIISKVFVISLIHSVYAQSKNPINFVDVYITRHLILVYSFFPPQNYKMPCVQRMPVGMSESMYFIPLTNKGEIFLTYYHSQSDYSRWSMVGSCYLWGLTYTILKCHFIHWIKNNFCCHLNGWI